MAKMEFGELDQYLFGQATHYDIYKKLGAHPVTQNGKSGTYFAVWAPGARRVSVVGDFNYWNGMLYPMHKMENSDIFELFILAIFKFSQDPLIQLFQRKCRLKVNKRSQFFSLDQIFAKSGTGT